VLEQLYAGVSARTRHVVERLERDFHRAGRILVPNLTDWTQTGKVLALLAAKYDYEQIGKGRLTNDALIAMSAGRLGITVITGNARDFGKQVQTLSVASRKSAHELTSHGHRRILLVALNGPLPQHVYPSEQLLLLFLPRSPLLPSLASSTTLARTHIDLARLAP
jgi:predicted nucleic acid-binding protein